MATNTLGTMASLGMAGATMAFGGSAMPNFPEASQQVELPQHSFPVAGRLSPSATMGAEIIVARPSLPIAALVSGESVAFLTVEDKIQKLAEIWKQYNRGRSVVEYNHAAYMQIIGIGAAAIPVLLNRLRAGDSDWVVALKYITGASVTTPEMRGNVRAILAAWLKWGYDNGIGQQLR